MKILICHNIILYYPNYSFLVELIDGSMNFILFFNLHKWDVYGFQTF
jgi:hypothetical protein